MRRTILMSVFLGAAALFSLNGCTMLGPDFKTPAAKTPTAWSEPDTELFQKPTAADTLGWWSTFNDPTLDQLIDLFSRQNLTLQTAALRIIEARAQLAIAQGFLYPQSQQATGDLFTIGTEQTATTQDRNFNSASLGFDVGWEMDFWGKYRRLIESADANLLAKMADYDNLLVSLTAETARTYVAIRTLQERTDLAQQNAELQQNSLELVELQFEAGVVTELDVLQAKTLLYSTQAAIPSLEAAIESAKYGLAVLVGVLPENIDALLDPMRPIPEVSSQIAVPMPADLLRRRPDVRSAEMAAAAQSAQIGVAETELYPSFSLFGSIGLGATDIGDASLGDIFDSDAFSYTFGPTFSWNLFNYGRLKNEVLVQDARFQQTILTYQNTVLNAAREVEEAMKNLIGSYRQAEYLEATVSTSQRSTDLSMLQYREGLVDYQRVLDSIRSLTLRQDQYATAKGDIATNTIALYKAFGGGWATDHDTDPLLPELVIREMEERTDWGSRLHPGAEAND